MSAPVVIGMSGTAPSVYGWMLQGMLWLSSQSGQRLWLSKRRRLGNQEPLKSRASNHFWFEALLLGVITRQELPTQNKPFPNCRNAG